MLLVVLVANLLVENMVDPHVTGHTLRIHPLVVLLVTTLGGVLGGLVGLMMAVPMTISAVRLVRYVRAAFDVERTRCDQRYAAPSPCPAGGMATTTDGMTRAVRSDRVCCSGSRQRPGGGRLGLADQGERLPSDHAETKRAAPGLTPRISSSNPQ